MDTQELNVGGQASRQRRKQTAGEHHRPLGGSIIEMTISALGIHVNVVRMDFEGPPSLP